MSQLFLIMIAMVLMATFDSHSAAPKWACPFPNRTRIPRDAKENFECENEVCDFGCLHGYKSDNNGCKICNCNDPCSDGSSLFLNCEPKCPSKQCTYGRWLSDDGCPTCKCCTKDDVNSK